MKSILLIALSVTTIAAFSQKTVDVSKTDASGLDSRNFMVVGGTPFVKTKFLNLAEGTPYFSDGWMKGNVQVTGGKEYAGIEMKLDLVDNELHYKDASGNEMIATSDVQKIVLADTVGQRLYTFVYSTHINTSSQIQKGWYVLLAESGELAIFKQLVKNVIETKQYNSATYDQTITTTQRYYVLYKNNFTQVKKIKEVPDILIDKKTDLLKYISKEGLMGKQDEDYEKLLQYYISLKQ